MSGKQWLILLVVIGVGLAILIGLLGSDSSNSQAEAQSNFCSSVTNLESSVQSLASLSPTSASKSDYDDVVSEIENDWDAVKADASDLASASMSELESAWDSFKSAVDDVPDDASVSEALSDIGSAAQTLATDAASTLSGPDC